MLQRQISFFYLINDLNVDFADFQKMVRRRSLHLILLPLPKFQEVIVVVVVAFAVCVEAVRQHSGPGQLLHALLPLGKLAGLVPYIV